LRCEFAILKEKVEDSNFTRVDSYAMKGLYAKLRNCASVIVGRNERSKLMEDINDAENLLFSFEEIVNCKEKSRGAPRYLCNNVDLVTDYIKSSGAIETEWALIGPFRNEGFDKVYPCEKSTDFSASYAGKDGQEIRWQKARGYFLQLHRFAGWSTRDPVGAPRKDMICFARTTVTSPDDREGTLVFRVDGRARIWLNGSEIGEGYSYSDASTPIPSETRIPIKLKKGPNDLQVKLESGGEDTAFFPVLKDSQDKTMQDITTSTDAPVIGSVFAHNLYLNVVDALGGQPKN
jgi:hypothetical protein